MNIPIIQFEERTGLSVDDLMLNTGHLSSVVSVKDLISIFKMEVMPKRYLRTLLSHVVLEGDRTCRVYKDCEITCKLIDPEDLYVGQTFVQRSKYQSLIENIPRIFDGYMLNEEAKCCALLIYGVSQYGTLALAHYVPPIVEVHGDHQVLLDGVHRNFNVRGVRTTIGSIVVRGVKVPFPCEPVCWGDVRVVEEKPPRHQRFNNLQPHLFRDLKYIGIDG